MLDLLIKRRPPKPNIDRRQSLDAVPVRNPSIEDETIQGAGDGMVIVSRIRRGRRWWSRFAPEVIEQRIELDEMGAFVFRRIDGEHTVKKIIEEFVRHFRVNRREAELSSVAFIRKLAQKRLISIVVK